MTTDPTDSAEQFDNQDAAGDAVSGVSGVSGSADGVPTPTGSIPPGPADPDSDGLESDDLTTTQELPPLGERMF